MPKALSIARQIALSLLLVLAALAVALLLGPPRALAPLAAPIYEALGVAGAAPEADAPARRRAGAGRARPVSAARVDSVADDLVLTAIGTGRAKRSVALRAERSGRVTRSALAAGARFAAGAALVEFDDEEARLAAAEAEARLANADRSAERYRLLQDTGAAAEAILDERETAAAVAKIALERARRDLALRVVRAPFDGVSALPEVEAGDWVEAGATLARFDDRSALYIEFEAPEFALPRLAIGDRATLRSPSAPGRELTAAVVAIDSRIDPDTRSATVRLEVPNDDDSLRPGAAFEIALTLPGPERPTVPELALLFGSDGLAVWRVAPHPSGATGDDAIGDGRAERLLVRLVRRRAGRVMVEGAIEPGDLVVIEGARRLRDGRPVRVVGVLDADAAAEAVR